jgi:hypothetical protein
LGNTQHAVADLQCYLANTENLADVDAITKRVVELRSRGI